MLKFKFSHSNALHSSRMGRLPLLLEICTLIKTIFWQMGGGRGAVSWLIEFEVTKTKVAASL